MTIKNKIDLLERNYEAFIHEVNSRDFFLGLADYLDFLNMLPEYLGIRNEIYAEKKPDDGWDIKNFYDVKRQIKLWQEIEKLELIRRIIKGLEIPDEKEKGLWASLSFPALAYEWKNILADGKDSEFGIVFDKEGVRTVAKRVHQYVLGKLSALLDNSDKTVICINTETNVLFKKTEPKAICQFKPNGGINRRFKYIIEIARADKGVAAEKLYPDHVQSLSTEIKNLNTRIKEDLKLTKDFIINRDNTGYRVNEEYEVEII